MSAGRDVPATGAITVGTADLSPAGMPRSPEWTTPGSVDLAPHVVMLLRSLLSPESIASLTLSDWDELVRVAESAELLGTLQSRLAAAGCLDAVPPGPARHLEGARVFHAHRVQMARHLLFGLDRALGDFEGKVILLKGAAYAMQEAAFARGRLFDDVDIMVEKAALPDVERRLAAAGWKSQKPGAYDQNYYRKWSHELPPMRHARYVLELDVHHTILPVTGRLRPDAAALAHAARPLPGTRWFALSPADQILHAAAHLFQDSDCTHRIRELFDVDGLIRHHAGPPLWGTLSAHAHRHGMGRPLWYAVHYARAWLGTPVPDDVLRALDCFAPPFAARRIMDAAIRRSLPPVQPDRRPPRRPPLFQRFLLARSVWLRMPPWLLAYHATMKWLNALRREDKPTTPE